MQISDKHEALGGIFYCFALLMGRVSEFFDKHPLLRKGLKYVLIFVLTLPLIALPFRGCCNSLFYEPVRVETLSFSAGQEVPKKYEIVKFSSLDGTELTGMVVYPETQEDKNGLIIYFHGRYGNILDPEIYEQWKDFRKHGYTVFAFDYRGFGASKGQPSREGIQQDAIAGINQAQKMFPDKEYMVDAKSLGGNVAIAALALGKFAKPIKALVTEATFSGYISAGNQAIFGGWLYCVAWYLATGEYSACDYVGKLPKELNWLMVHATEDPRVSYQEAIELLKLQPSCEVTFQPVKSSDHLNLYKPENFEGFIKHCDKVLSASTTLSKR